ncbi:acetyl-CoA carboxylase biotin carboxyl carrier protein [Bacillus horti]|uniref:Biotin carboxyl carrier protein of acetyl-CoA carboxylase n=1 Tax=Caldalkalibacillus horti TaxID=77523 RepID=A0ABT9W1B6_9BACI|nr:acetyl-CoA carboxylase biotin carboxyl carrier protein [Bacillus horti]
MKMHEIRELIKLVDHSSLTDFDYEYEGLKISLKKEAKLQGGSVVQSTSPVEVQAVTPNVPAVQATEQNGQSNTPQIKQEATVQDQAGLHQICSPMVGTFYSAPAPDADPYIKAGDKVSNSSVVCIVEAMKLMNEIEAEVRGEIVDILVENGQLVEYGQPLFLVKAE